MKLLNLPVLFAIGSVLLTSGCDGESNKNSNVEPDKECSEPTPYTKDDSCVACLEDSHCPGEKYCDLVASVCKCPESTPHFDEEKCHECLVDKHCPGPLSCDLGTMSCADATCPEETPHLVDGACVECAHNGHCKGELICKASAGQCQCADESRFVFEDQCVECLKSTDCPPGQYCKDNACVGEEDVTNCPDETPHNFNGECWECLEDSHCTGEGEYCHEELLYCVPPELVCEGETPHKYLGECVECLENAHCGEGEICNKSEHACEDEPVSPGECVFGGTGSQIGDLIGDFGALECSGEAINLHNFCGNRKAVWLISVAGWCGACDEWAPEANKLYEESKGQGLLLIFVLGENPEGKPPTPDYCQQWKESHGVTAPIMLDAHWAGLDSKITTSGAELPWDYLLDGDNMEYVWESVEFNTDDLLNKIEMLLAD